MIFGEISLRGAFWRSCCRTYQKGRIQSTSKVWMLSCFTISKKKQPLHQATPERLCQSSVFVVKNGMVKTQRQCSVSFFLFIQKQAYKGGRIVGESECTSKSQT